MNRDSRGSPDFRASARSCRPSTISCPLVRAVPRPLLCHFGHGPPLSTARRSPGGPPRSPSAASREVGLLALAVDHRQDDHPVAQEAGVADPVRPALAPAPARPGETDLPEPTRTRDDRVSVRPFQDRRLEGPQVLVSQVESRPCPSESREFDELRPLGRDRTRSSAAFLPCLETLRLSRTKSRAIRPGSSVSATRMSRPTPRIARLRMIAAGPSVPVMRPDTGYTCLGRRLVPRTVGTIPVSKRASTADGDRASARRRHGGRRDRGDRLVQGGDASTAAVERTAQGVGHRRGGDFSCAAWAAPPCSSGTASRSTPTRSTSPTSGPRAWCRS